MPYKTQWFVWLPIGLYAKRIQLMRTIARGYSKHLYCCSGKRLLSPTLPGFPDAACDWAGKEKLCHKMEWALSAANFLNLKLERRRCGSQDADGLVPCPIDHCAWKCQNEYVRRSKLLLTKVKITCEVSTGKALKTAIRGKLKSMKHAKAWKAISWKACCRQFSRTSRGCFLFSVMVTLCHRAKECIWLHRRVWKTSC